MPYTVDVDESGRITWPPIDTETERTPMGDTQEHMRRVLTLLARGPITDKSGLAANVLAKRLRWKHTGGALSALVNKLVDMGVVDRETRGRRTFAISLTIEPGELPAGWIDEPEPEPAPAPRPPEQPAANGAAEVDLVETAPPDADEWLAAVTENGGVDYRLLATALLERVVDVVTHDGNGKGDDEYDRAVVLSVQL